MGEEVIIFSALYAVLIFTDLVPVYQTKKKKAIFFCTALFVIAIVLQFLIIFQVELPRYADLFEFILNSITGKRGE